MTTSSNETEIDSAVQSITGEVVGWGPGEVTKEFSETTVPNEVLKGRLAAQLGGDYVVFVGRRGVVVKRRGL
jgi:hypothetical protein